MPYNPNSAYPRQSIHVPVVHGWDRRQAVNAPSWEPVKARAVQFQGYGSAFARNQQSAVGMLNSPVAQPLAQNFNRKGIMDQVQGAQREAAGRKQNRQATRKPTAPGNNEAVAVQDNAEQVVENPNNGTATASPELIIPPWRSGSRRR
jgi:hypothetical protein